MLCPQCGAPVGDTPRLCGRCEAEKAVFAAASVSSGSSAGSNPPKGKPNTGVGSVTPVRSTPEAITAGDRSDGVAGSKQTGGDGVEELASVPTVEPGAGRLGNSVFGSEPPPRPQSHFGYAGYWLRFFALLIDLAITLTATAIFLLIVARIVPIEQLVPAVGDGSIEALKQLGALMLVVAILFWLYFALFESSAWGGTPGKIAFGLRVLDLEAEPVTIVGATVRYVAKLLPIFMVAVAISLAAAVSGDRSAGGLAALTVVVLLSSGAGLLSFATQLMAGLTKRKQALHDLIAGTLVVRSVSYSFSRYAVTAIVAVLLFLIQQVTSPAIFDFGAPALNLRVGNQQQVESAGDVSSLGLATDPDRSAVPDQQLESPPVEVVSSESVAPPSKVERMLEKLAELKAGLKKKPSAPRAYAVVGDVELYFTDQFALYYPQYGRLEIGFYDEPVTDKAKKAIVASRFLRTASNPVRPGLMLLVLLKDPDDGLKVDNVQEYTLQFFREFGLVSLPGGGHTKEFVRSGGEVAKEEFRSISGGLSEGAVVEGAVVGLDSKNGVDFNWALHLRAPVAQVRVR